MNVLSFRDSMLIFLFILYKARPAEVVWKYSIILELSVRVNSTVVAHS
jgi:hypothetical protein